MSDSPPREPEASELDRAERSGSPLDATPPPDQPRRLGSGTFSLEGRATPGLYLVGWVATVFGLALFLVAVMSRLEGLTGLGITLLSMTLLSTGLIAAAGAQGAQRRARAAAQGAAPGYVGPSPFLVFGASLPVTVLIVVVLLTPASGLGFDPLSPLGAFVQVSITALVYAGLVRLLVVGTGALSWAEMGIKRLPARQVVADLLYGASFAIPVIFVTAVVAALLVGLLDTIPDSPLPTTTTTEGFLLNMLSGAVVAPIGEEIFYRGFAFTAWYRTMGERPAIIRSALFFALVHVLTVGGATFSDAAPRALIGFAVRVPVAFALAWVFVRRGSLIAPIGLHAAFNGILLVISESAPDLPAP